MARRIEITSQRTTDELMEGTDIMAILYQHVTNPRKDTKWRKYWRTGWEKVASFARNIETVNRMEV